MLTFSAQRCTDLAKSIRVKTKGSNAGGVFTLEFKPSYYTEETVWATGYSDMGYVISLDHYYIIITYWYILVCYPASLTSLSVGFNSINDIQEVLDTQGTEILYKELV